MPAPPGPSTVTSINGKRGDVKLTIDDLGGKVAPPASVKGLRFGRGTADQDRAANAADIPALNANKIVAGVFPPERLGIDPDGNGTKILYDDGVWRVPSGGGASVGTDVQKGDGSGGFAAALAADVVSLFGTPSGKFLKDDGTLATPPGAASASAAIQKGDGSGGFADADLAALIALIGSTTQNFFLAGPAAGGAGAALKRAIVYSDIASLAGATSTTFAVGNDTRFPASVTGIRKSAGAGSTDTVLTGLGNLVAATPDGTSGAALLRALVGNDFAGVLTTKGDLIAGSSGGPIRIPIGGTNGFALIIDSTTTPGMKWAFLNGTSIGFLTGTDRARPAPTVANVYLATDTFQVYASDTTQWYNTAAGWDRITVDSTLVATGFADASYLVGPVGANNAPMMTPPYTIAFGMNVVSLPGTAGSIPVGYGASGTNAGWYLRNSPTVTNTMKFGASAAGGFTEFALTGFTLTTGFHVLALNWSGTNLRYSWDGGTVQTVAASLTYVPPTAACNFAIGRWVAAGGLFCNWMRWGQIYGYNSLLADLDLQALGANTANFKFGFATANLLSTNPQYMNEGRWFRNEGAGGSAPIWPFYGLARSKFAYIGCVGNSISKTFEP